jgi:hypothetical protein
MPRLRIRALALLLLPLAGSCQQIKSDNPLSPYVAGPMAGVSISTPSLLKPPGGAQVPSDQQPVSLVVQNASTNSVRPLNYEFQIAVDAAFGSMVFSQTGVPPGSSGTTTLTLPGPLSTGRTYYWRVRAQDGANTSSYSQPGSFTVFTPVVIQAPVPLSPADGATLTTSLPTLVVANAARSGPAGALSYLFQIASDAVMAKLVASGQVGEGQGQTQYTPSAALSPGVRYYWRAQAFDGAGHTGAWSSVTSFVTSGTSGPGPSPSPGAGPGDQLDLHTVTIVKGADITNWAITSQMISVTYSNGTLCTNHTKAGQWPPLPFFGDPSTTVEANQWVFANIGGQWYGGAGEWLRPGQTCKSVSPAMGPDTFYDSPPLRDWIPQPGEMVGFAVSTPARAGQWGTAERSNVVVIAWPGGNRP